MEKSDRGIGGSIFTNFRVNIFHDTAHEIILSLCYHYSLIGIPYPVFITSFLIARLAAYILAILLELVVDENC
jgi:hypothetical protein